MGVGLSELWILFIVVVLALVIRNYSAFKRFSLRALLIFFTGIALLLGVVVVSYRYLH
jgi:hypothetical protein